MERIYEDEKEFVTMIAINCFVLKQLMPESKCDQKYKRIYNNAWKKA